MMVISIIDDVTLKVIHYTGEVADAARDGAVSSFSFFSSFGGRDETDCRDDQGAGAGGNGSAAVVENNVKISISNETLELLEYSSEGAYKVFPPKDAIERARSRLGEREYGLFKNNCECFVNWAITGHAVSIQFEAGKWTAGLGAVFGAYSGYKEGGWSALLKGAVAGAHQGYQYHRENRQ